MRAMVTGGAGFIGSHVVDALLERGDEVHVVDNFATGSPDNLASAANLHELDIRDRALEDLVARRRPNVIFHLAAQADVGTSVERPTFDADVNVVGTVRVLEAARTNDARLVFASTGGAMYGECQLPATESDSPQPSSPYAASKLAGEGYLATWNRLYAVGPVTCRLANVYGPRQLPTLEGGVVAIFLERMRLGEETEIFGDGNQTRDFVYVGDVVTALLAAGASSLGGIFNVGSGAATTIRELHRLCAEISGAKREPIFAAERSGDLRRSVVDSSRAARELQWQAETTLAVGLAKTWDAIA